MLVAFLLHHAICTLSIKSLQGRRCRDSLKPNEASPTDQLTLNLPPPARFNCTRRLRYLTRVVIGRTAVPYHAGWHRQFHCFDDGLVAECTLVRFDVNVMTCAYQKWRMSVRRTRACQQVRSDTVQQMMRLMDIRTFEQHPPLP
jgi:hypothetical protein